MNYAIVSSINGTFKIESEHGQDKQAAFVNFHSLCRVYWNASDVISGMVKVVDENLDVVDGKMEYITHEPIQNNQSVEETEFEC